MITESNVVHMCTCNPSLQFNHKISNLSPSHLSLVMPFTLAGGTLAHMTGSLEVSSCIGTFPPSLYMEVTQRFSCQPAGSTV